MIFKLIKVFKIIYIIFIFKDKKKLFKKYKYNIL